MPGAGSNPLKINGGSVWGSNPPVTSWMPPTGFEVRSESCATFGTSSLQVQGGNPWARLGRTGTANVILTVHLRSPQGWGTHPSGMGMRQDPEFFELLIGRLTGN
jgi:hypothetical protein